MFQNHASIYDLAVVRKFSTVALMTIINKLIELVILKLWQKHINKPTHHTRSTDDKSAITTKAMGDILELPQRWGRGVFRSTGNIQKSSPMLKFNSQTLNTVPNGGWRWLWWRHDILLLPLDTLSTGDVLTANELRTKRLLPLHPGQQSPEHGWSQVFPRWSGPFHYTGSPRERERCSWPKTVRINQESDYCGPD